ncbi:MAG: hypothetical protein VX768_15425, partial [Planctomycetota bacterium]|nr:hypothetical protein [Planctomycetota bacterium]
GSSWSVMDLIVGAVVCFVVAAVLLPSISNSRFQANLLKCEDNLRQIGYSMASIADSHEGRLVVPEAETTGQWNASLFVEKMFASELANDTAQFICPSDPAREKTAEICKQAWSEIHLALPEQQVPSPTELVNKGDADASIPQPFLTTDPVAGRLDTLRQSEAACGSYGFPAPQVASTSARLKSGLTSAPLQSGLPGSDRFRSNEFEAIRVPSSPYLVLCADAACFENPGYRSRNHGGRGQNVLLGDLSVDYITESACLATGDHIYTNNQGQIQPGVSPGDNLIFRGVLQVIGNR